MASRALIDGRASALPLSVALSLIPSLPRPLLARLVERAIERLDELDGDAEREPDDEPEDGADAEAEPPEVSGTGYGIDQRIASVGHGSPWHIDRERSL
jgi:hypothetical protein